MYDEKIDFLNMQPNRMYLWKKSNLIVIIIRKGKNDIIVREGKMRNGSRT